jgi:hypothetical protein
MLIRLKKSLGSFPLVGGLMYCQWSDHWDALKEFSTTLFWAFMPIWLGAFVLYIMDVTGKTSYAMSLHEALFNGELYIYASSLLAPIFYMALEEQTSIRSFYSKLAHMIFVGAIIVLSAALFSISRLGVAYNKALAFKVSYWLLIVAVSIYYIAIVYNNNRRNPAAQMRHDEDEYAEDYSKHRS